MKKSKYKTTGAKIKMKEDHFMLYRDSMMTIQDEGLFLWINRSIRADGEMCIKFADIVSIRKVKVGLNSKTFEITHKNTNVFHISAPYKYWSEQIKKYVKENNLDITLDI